MQDRQIEQEASALPIVRNLQVAVELPHHPGDHLEPQAGTRLLDVKAFGQAGAMVGYFDVKVSVDFPCRDLDLAATIRIGILDGVGDQLIDQKSQRNGVIGRFLSRALANRCCWIANFR